MHHLLLTLLSLFLIYKQTFCEESVNATTTSLPESPSTTEMYTSSILADVTVDSADDPTSEEDECLFELTRTLSSTEDIHITICGFKETITVDEKEIDQIMVGITLQMPIDRWTGVGFILSDEYTPGDAMKEAYAFIIPRAYYGGRAIQEVNFNDRTTVQSGEGGESLMTTMEWFEDKIDGNDRILKVKRKVEILPTDLTSEFADDVLKYFDFTSVTESCNTEFYIIWAFGSENKQKFKLNDAPSYHGALNRGVTKVSLDEIKGQSCEDQSENANSISYMVAMIVSVVVGAHVLYV